MYYCVEKEIRKSLESSKINNRKTKVPGRLIHTNIMEIIAIKTIAAIIILSIYSFLIFDGYFLSIPGREFISNSISISSRITLSLVVSLAERS